jgi:hypothetical protein
VRDSTLAVYADLEAIDALGSADFDEIARTVELLFNLIPRRTVKR